MTAVEIAAEFRRIRAETPTLPQFELKAENGSLWFFVLESGELRIRISSRDSQREADVKPEAVASILAELVKLYPIQEGGERE